MKITKSLFAHTQPFIPMKEQQHRKNHINVRLSGENREDGYAVYKIREMAYKMDGFFLQMWETKMLEIMDWITNDVDWITGEHHENLKIKYKSPKSDKKHFGDFLNFLLDIH